MSSTGRTRRNLFARALELNPSLTQAYTAYSYTTACPLGQHATRLSGSLRTALKHDPLSLAFFGTWESSELQTGKYEEAIDYPAKREKSTDPGSPRFGYLGRALMCAGRHRGGDSIEESAAGPWRASGSQGGSPCRGRRGRLRADRAIPFRLAIIYAALGDKDRTFEALQRVRGSSRSAWPTF